MQVTRNSTSNQIRSNPEKKLLKLETLRQKIQTQDSIDIYRTPIGVSLDVRWMEPPDWSSSLPNAPLNVSFESISH